MGRGTRTTRWVLPLATGVAAALVLAAAGAVALPGAYGSERTPTVDATAGAVGVSVPAVPASKAEVEPATAPKVDLEKVAEAHDSFPDVTKDQRAAADAKQAQRVASKQAQLEAEAAKRDEQDAAAEKERLAAEKRAAEKETEKPKEDAPAKDEPVKDDRKDEDAPTAPAWWPGHRWAHAVDCTVDGQTAVGTWDLWLKYGGDWRFVSASPSPTQVSGTDGDKVKLVYADHTASFHKQHEDETKFRGGPVSVTVANAADASQTKTFDVDLWVVARDDGTCPA